MKTLFTLLGWIFIASVLTACGQATKVYHYGPQSNSGHQFALMQEGEFENRLRVAMLNEGLSISAFHQEIKGTDRQTLTYKQPDWLIKVQVQEDRPCLIGRSSLVYGKLEVIQASTGSTMKIIEEMGFTEPCMGSEAIYGNVFKKLAKTLAVQQKKQ
jgi:hypothetical protein